MAATGHLSDTEAQAPSTSADLALGSALGLVLLLTSTFALGQVLLLAGGRISAVSAAVVLAASSALSLLVARKVAGRWRAAGGVVAVVAVAILASALLIDTSFDGQGYHSDAVTALAQGWNPLRDPVPAPDTVKVVGPLEAWVSHYPQGVWISSALQAAVGLPLEATKSQALIAMAALFLAVLGTGLRFGLNGLVAFVLAAMAAANPVLLAQLFTRMNDGLLGACFALTATFFALWLKRPSWWSALGMACPLILAINLKFSAIPTAVGLCALICLLAVWLAGWRVAIRAAVILALTGAAAIVVFGAHPYLTNTLRQGHPFYPLMGVGKADIMTGNRPAWLQDRSPAERIAASYFGATASGYGGGEHVKAPFTLTRGELSAAGGHDVRIGGFGPLFSGALCLGAILGAAAWIQRSRPPPVAPLLAAATGVLVLALVMPEAWWARYTPQVWQVPVLVALAAMVSRLRALRIGGAVLAAVILADAGLVAASSALQVGRANLEIHDELAQIARSPRAVCVHVGAAHSRLALIKDIPTVRLRPRPLKDCRATLLAGTDVQSLSGYCPCP